MVTASRMQNMVQLCKKHIYFETKRLFRFFVCGFVLRALGVESPRGGAIKHISTERTHAFRNAALGTRTHVGMDGPNARGTLNKARHMSYSRGIV